MTKEQLNDWQKAVVNTVENHFDDRDVEENLGLSDFEINRKLSVNVALPDKNNDNLNLVNFLANNYPCLVVYKNMEDYRNIIGSFDLPNDSKTISWYEIYYIMHTPDPNRPSPEYLDLIQKFEGRHVVVYKGLSLNNDIKNFLLAEAKGAVVLLGQ